MQAQKRAILQREKYQGIAAGITALELSTGQLAVRYFLVGVVVILIRGIVTERITVMLMKKQAK